MVNVTGFKTTEGHGKIWLFNSAEEFPFEDKKELRCVEAPIRALTSRFVFDLLPASNYALGFVA